MPQNTTQRLLLITLAGVCVSYCVAVLAVVATTPDISLRGLIAGSSEPEAGESLGFAVRVVDDPSLRDALWPADGDVLLELGGRRTRTFVDFSQALTSLGNPPDNLVGSVPAGMDLNDPLTGVPPAETTDAFKVSPSGQISVKVWFRRSDNPSQVLGTWMPLKAQPPGGLVLSLVWFLLQGATFLLAGLAYWKRPFDRPLRVFFTMCCVTVVAYIGGNHWWMLAGNLWFVVPFTIAAIFLPAVLLHFFLVYPFAKPVVSRWPRASLACVYAIPLTTSLLLLTVFLSGGLLSRELTSLGPLTDGVEGLMGAVVAWLMPKLRIGVYTYFVIAAGYFVLSLAALVDSVRRARNSVELAQVKWLLWAGLLAAVPVAYTLGLAYFDRISFAFGGARMPMFLASLSFTAAYVVGIARHKLMLIDQVVDRGVMYYVLSFGLTILFALMIVAAGLLAWQGARSVYGYVVPVILLMTVSVVVLSLIRDASQRALDRWYFREKYPLDRALQRMNRTVSSLLARGDVGDNMLLSCCDALRVEQGALYLRDGHGEKFRLTGAVGHADLPMTLDAPDDMVTTLSDGTALQRIPGGTSSEQLALRRLDAELIHALEVDGELTGFVALGAKPHGAAYSAEDVTFLTAISRITSVALHCAKVHEDMTRLNEELRRKTERISEQNRQISLLQSEVAEFSDAPDVRPQKLELRENLIRGRSPAIHGVLETVRKVSASDASVLIRGESGTGKELLARTIHQNSARHDQPLVSVHCAALAPSLLESELFGHVKGAFTGATADKPGRFAAADGGTLFLDEVGDIPLEVQVKLLRVLQERTFEPVGSSRSVSVDVRLIAATHQNLERLITEGRFREDLYYRLNVISITLPPLRERGDDIFELAVFFLRRASERSGKRISGFDDKALTALLHHDWPGNVRELENVIERAVVLADSDRLTAADVAPHLSSNQILPRVQPVEAPQNALPLPLTAARRTQAGTGRPLVIGSREEREVLQAALMECNGNKAEAARLLDMPRSTYYSKLKRHGLG